MVKGLELCGGFEQYLVLNIEIFKNIKGEIQNPTYNYDKFLNHIIGHKEMMKERYKGDQIFRK